MKKIADVMVKAGKWLLVLDFIFLQLSFPLEIFAEEIINEDTYNGSIMVDENINNLESVQVDSEKIDEAVITINGEQTTEYTIKGVEDTEVTIVLEYQGKTETVVFNFSNKLYGVYQYFFESVDRDIVINYPGNNIDLLNQYKNIVDGSKKVTCNSDECVIAGFGSDLVTVADITSYYYNLEDFERDYNASVIVKHGEDVLLENDTIISGYKLVIVDNMTDEVLLNSTPSSHYMIYRAGDIYFPADGLIDVKDQEVILDCILQENVVNNLNDVNGDGFLNILDATHSVFIDFNAGEGYKDVLTTTLSSSSDEILIGETVEVKLFVSGFENLSLYGIEGFLEYDNSVLELVSASLYEVPELQEKVNMGYLNLANNKFAYVLNDGFNSEEDALLTLKFEALSLGNTEITVKDIVLSHGEVIETANNSFSINVNVAEYGKGGDVEGDDSTPEEDVKEEDNIIENTNKDLLEDSNPVVKPVVLSSDYYIRQLVIDGYKLDFDMYTYEYDIKVENDVEALDFDILLNNSNSIYYIEGNENFEVGENLVRVVVKAENGSTKTYTIKVEKAEKEVVKDSSDDDDELEKTEDSLKNNFSKTVIIILIILVIIGLIYVIFKDDEEENQVKEVKKETKPEKIKEEVKIEKVEKEKTNISKSKNTKKTSKSSKKK